MSHPNLSKTIVELRKEKGWKREQLAVAAGVCSNTIGKIERGETTHIKLSTIKKLARAFNMTASELIQGE